jgi:very-short-patch-repair endonuclease
MKECKYCKGEVISKSNNAKFCSIECRDKNKFEENQRELLKGVEGYDYVIDRWNGFVTPRIFGKWFSAMHPGRTTQQYRQQFPDAKLQCDKISEKNGQFMKDDKHREAQRERMLGKGNPNHSSKTTKEQRQAKSPFSKKFVKYKSEEDRQKFIESVDYGSIKKSSDLEWWIEKCNGDIEMAKALHRERQSTFTLEKCIERHGEKRGTKIFNERQEKWSSKIEEMYQDGQFTRFCKSNWSKSEVNFINDLVKSIKLKDDEYYSTVNGNQFFRHFKELGRTFAYDFVYGRKVIEFNGDYWHMNPDKYDENDFNKSIQETAGKKWESDTLKNSMIESHGYKVLTVWESEYTQNPEETIQKCIQFLNE